MNRQEKIARLQTLLERIHKRSQAPRERTCAEIVGGRTPSAQAKAEVQIEVGLPVVPRHVEPIAAPPPTQEQTVSQPMAVPRAEPVALPVEPVAEKTPVQAPIGLTPAGVVQSMPVAPVPPVVEAELKPPTAAAGTGMAVEQPPASSKRPILGQTPEPAAVAPGAELELDLVSAVVASPKAEVSVEQLGQTIELERPTEHKIELAMPEPPLPDKQASSSDMEVVLPTSVSPGMVVPEVPPPTSGVFVLPEPLGMQDLAPDSEASGFDEQEEGATIQMEVARPVAPPVVIEAPESESLLTLQTTPPAMEIGHEPPAATGLAQPTPNVPQAPPSSTPGVLAPIELRPTEVKEEIVALEIVSEPATAGPSPERQTPVTVRVHATAFKGSIAVATDEAVLFVGAVKTFQPSSFIELLDASLSL